DDRSATEERREPWGAGGDVALAGPRALADEEAEVGDAPGDRQVEQLVVGRNRGRATGPRVIRGRALVGRNARDLRKQLGPIAPGSRLGNGGFARPDRPGQLVVATRLQRPDPAQADGAALVGWIAGPDGLDRRRFGKGNVGSSLPLIEPVVAERHPRVGRSDRQE